MLNVQALTQTLSAMPLAQLQQYASLHKNDPYVVTMALSIANQKKQAMAAQQGQAGQQPQRKVIEAEIEGMGDLQNADPAKLARMSQLLEALKQAEHEELTGGSRTKNMPEHVGIGQLPAQNMQGMADGGIVGYSGEDESLVRSPLAFLNPGDILGGLWGGAKRVFNEGIDPAAAQQRRETEAQALAENTSGMDRRLQAAPTSMHPPSTAAVAPTATGTPPIPPAPVAQPNTGIATLPTGAGAMRMPSQADQFKQYQEILTKTKAEDPAEAERKALGAEMVSQTERRQKAYDEEQAARGDVYKGREERLSKQEAEITGRKATNEGLAFLNAGLAIMSTPGGLAMAIGKGARVGTEQYAAGLEKIQAAQDKLGEARDRLDDLRINRADMTAKERRDLQAQADTAKLEAKKLTIDGIMSAANVSEKRAATMYDASVKYGIAQLEQSGANARANAQVAATLNTPERQMWNQVLAKHGGNTEKAFKELQTLKSEKFNPYQSYSDYLKAFAGKETITPPMAFDQYAAQFAVPTVKAPPAGAAVFKQPG